MLSSSFYMPLVHVKCASRLSRLHTRWVFLVKLGMKVDMKFTVPSKLWSSCLSFGATSAVISFTVFGHSWTACGVMMRPKYLICCFLKKHLLGLNLSLAWHAFSTVSNRCMSWRSSVDPCTLTSFAHGNVPGMPVRIRSMCSQKIADDADNPKGGHPKQYFLKGVLNAVRGWLCLVQYPLLASSVEKYWPFLKLLNILPRCSVVDVAAQVLIQVSWIKAKT